MNTTTAPTRHLGASSHQTDGRRSLALVSADGESQIKKFLAEPSQPNHIVQFYESDGFLGDTVAHSIGAGLANGEPTLVIATASHRAAFRERLERHAFDLVRAKDSGLYTEIDARDMLEQFMAGSIPDPIRFRELVGNLIAKAQAVHPKRRLRAYGEMVDQLWRDGNKRGALALEELWNELGRTQSFSLLCAYGMRNFETADDSASFEAVCHTHTHVIPAEGYSEVGDANNRLREITLLQQRAASLEYEISRRKELENELREALGRAKDARTEAERTVRYNEMFAGILGHDLRNPLNAILTTAHYIARSSPDAKATAAAIRIAASSQRMARMIEQLLDFTQIRVGEGLALQRARVDLAEVCVGIKAELESAHPGSSIEVSSRGNTVGDLDYDRMLQVLSNLVGNAVHHGAGDSAVTVEADGTDPEGLVVQVNNAGVVAAEVLPVLFEPFRAVSKGHHSRGLGLGLYITRQIVAAHGGNVAVVSNEADGTTFRLELPRCGSCLHN